MWRPSRAREQRRCVPRPTRSRTSRRIIPFPITDHGLMKLEAERAVAAAVRGRRHGAHLVALRHDQCWHPSRPTSSGRSTGRSTMIFFTDEFRCPAHAADVAAALSALAGRTGHPRATARRRARGSEPRRTGRDVCRWMGLDPRLLSTSTVEPSRPGPTRPGRPGLHACRDLRICLPQPRRGRCRPPSAVRNRSSSRRG